MKTLFFLIPIALMIAPAAQAACENSTSVEDLVIAIQAGEQAFANADDVAFSPQVESARKILPCVSEMVTIHDAAAYHRLMAMDAFIAGDDNLVITELRASYLIDPNYEFPSSVADADHPLLSLYDQAKVNIQDTTEAIGSPEMHTVVVDGNMGGMRPMNTPVIVQLFDAAWVAQKTDYLQPGDPHPTWGLDLSVPPEPENPIKPPRERTGSVKRAAPWYIATGGAAIASGALWALAQSNKSDYQDPATPDEDLQGLQTRANTMATTSMIAGGVGVALGVTGVTVQFTFGKERE